MKFQLIEHDSMHTTHTNGGEKHQHHVAVLIKAALDAATELDWVKNSPGLAQEERERAEQIVERVYIACETLGTTFKLAEVGA